METLVYINRLVGSQITESLQRKRNLLILGPRQTGKTTFVKNLTFDRYINLMDIETRQLFESSPQQFAHAIVALQHELGRKPLVIVDEIQ